MRDDVTMVDDVEIAVLARANGVGDLPDAWPDAWLEGVRTNLVLLRHYSALIEAVDLPERLEPAFVYTP